MWREGEGVMFEATRLRQQPFVETHILPDGSCLLFDTVTDRGFALNATGALVWEYCDGELTGAEVAQVMASLLPQYADIGIVTDELLSELVGLGLLASGVATPNQRHDEESRTSQ
jgi:hypothetical protein